ncbi:hypothetical protein COV12_02990 [Candidatus Woesearchaeota archaeon CG10_big_fil_rev_8_21_14_0_10_32_24]|nr:MAG: hypothetical protein COV12_02990 [Candidatus Woesearchaeota archaeon CG10_big_fil_rev_8_21_14_0_10_32_24]
MSKKILMGVEVGLLAVLIIAAIFIIDTSKVSGLIILGIALILVFGVVVVLEKKRESLPEEEEGQTIEQTPGEDAVAQVYQKAEATAQQTQSPPPTYQTDPRPIRNIPAADIPVVENEEEIKSKINTAYRWRRKV